MTAIVILMLALDWRLALISFIGVPPVAVSGAWTAADTFTLDVVRYRTPFVARYHLKISGDRETERLETVMNVGPTPPALVGRRE